MSYLNIKWSYRFASHFFCSAHASMPTARKKSYKHFMLSSQHRNINGSKLCSFACYAIASVDEAVQTHAAKSGVRRKKADGLFLCHLTTFSQWQCLRQQGCFALFYLNTGQPLRFKAATVIKEKVSYGWQKKIIDCSHS